MRRSPTLHAAAFAAILALGAPPLAAQVSEGATGEEGSASEGLGLIEEGARMFFRGIISEMEPALDQLRDRAVEMEPAVRAFAREMGPALIEMLSRIDDIRFYEAPEVLDNGDIVIRRSPDAPPYEPLNPDPDAIDGPIPEDGIEL